MMTGTGRVAVGESAASKKYRMTLAGDKTFKSSPPSESRGQEPFPVTLPDPPQPPRPAMTRPTPPRKMREWEDHGWMYRLRHHANLYNHGRAARKYERGEEEKREYARDLERYRLDLERFNREDAAYKEQRLNYAHVMVTPPAPTQPPLEDLEGYEKAVVGLREQIVMVAQRRERQFSYVMETQELCQKSYKQATDYLLVAGSEAAAALKAMDYLSATKELGRAKNKYHFLVQQESTIVNDLEMAADTEFNRAVDNNRNVIREKAAEDLEEIKAMKKDLEDLNLPDSVLQESQQANKDLATVLAEMQEKIKNETRQDLGMDVPRQHVKEQEGPTAMLI